MAMENMVVSLPSSVISLLNRLIWTMMNIQCHTLNKALHKPSEEVILAP